MSENPTTPTPGGEPEKPKRKRRARWSRRLAWTFGILLALAILFRLTLPLLFPAVLKKVAAAYNMEARYERTEFSLLSGDAGLWHLTLTPKGTDQPVLYAAYMRGNISTWALLRGKLDVWRVEADSVDVHLVREKDGRIPLLEQLLSSSTPAPVVKPAPATQPIDLTPPLKLDAFRLNRVNLKLEDRSVSPAFETVLTLDVRLSDVASARRTTRFEIALWSEQMLDSLRLEGTARTEGGRIEATAGVEMRGLHLAPVGGYLAPLGLKPVAQSIGANARATIRVATTQPANAVSAQVELSGINANVDGEEFVGVDRVFIDANALSGAMLRISQFFIEGGRSRVVRSEDGNLQFAGLELTTPTAAPTTRPAEKTDAQQPPAPATASTPLRIVLDEIRMTNCRAALHDDAVTSQANVELVVDDLSIRDLALDPQRPDAALQLAGKLHAPGLAKQIRIDGSATPGTPQKNAQFTINGEGINAESLRPYLDALGLESLLKDARFSATLAANWTLTPGGISAGAKFSGIKFIDGADLLAMSDITLAGVSTDAQTGLLNIGTIELAGPVLSATRDSSGAVNLLGMRYRGIPPPEQGPGASPPPTLGKAPAVPPIPTPPRIQIGLLRWKDIKLQFVDQTISPPSTVSLADAGVELRDFRMDLESTSAGSPGHLKAWIESPDFAERIDIAGTLTPAQGQLDIALNLIGAGITGRSARPYLASIGVEPTLANGQLKASVKTSLRKSREQDELKAMLSVEEFKLADGEQELLGVDGVVIQAAGLKDEIVIDEVSVMRPRAVLARDADGALRIAGIRTMVPAPSTQPAGVAPPPAADDRIANPLELPLALVPTTLKSLKLADAAITWSDAAVAPEVHTTARVSAQLSNVVLGKKADPGRYELSLTVDDVVESLKVIGELLASPQAQKLTADVKGEGIRPGPLAAYLPAGVESTLEAGKITAAIEATIDENPEGGKSARLLVNGVDWRDGETALFKLDSAKVLARRVDPANDIIAASEITTVGIELDVFRKSDGRLTALGLALNPAVQESAAPMEAAPTTQAMIATTGPASEDVEAMIARARRALPLIMLDKLDLNVERIGFTDETRPGSTPLAVRAMNLANLQPIELAGKDPANRKPFNLKFAAKLDPLVESISLTATAAPFAQQPTLSADLLLAGIQGEGLVKLAPELARHIDGSTLTAGEFRSHLEASARLQRRGPYDFDFSKGFDLDLLVKDIAWRAESGGEILAGLEEIETQGARIEPAKGNVMVKTLEITKPIFHGWRDEAGIHILGWIVQIPGKEQPAGTQPSTQPQEQTIAIIKPEDAGPSETASASSAPPPNVIRIDKLLVSGLDVRVEDRTTTPKMMLPLSELDVEVRGLSNQAFYDGKPIRFNALVNSGKTGLPTRSRGAVDMENLTEREVFSQISAAGVIKLHPKPEGWAKIGINGFETLSVAGPAAEAGVNVGGGIYDGRIDLRFDPDGSIKVNSRHVVTDLKLTEGDDGPIRRSLKLPSPLNVVIDTMEDPDGSITLRVPVTIKEGEIKGIGSAVAGAVSGVVVTALASAPVKVAAGIGSLVGIKGKKGEPIEPVVISFSPGYGGIDPSQRQAIATMVDYLRKDKNTELTLRHELGGGDVARAEMRANPSETDIVALAYDLRQRKMLLSQRRADLAGQAVGQLALLPAEQTAPTIETLRDLDRQIARNEDALDEVYELLRPGAQRQASRRTRAAALSLASARLEALKADILLMAGDLPRLAERIHIVNPTFAPAETDLGGSITATVVAKKKG